MFDLFSNMFGGLFNNLNANLQGAAAPPPPPEPAAMGTVYSGMSDGGASWGYKPATWVDGPLGLTPQWQSDNPSPVPPDVPPQVSTGPSIPEPDSVATLPTDGGTLQAVPPPDALKPVSPTSTAATTGPTPVERPTPGSQAYWEQNRTPPQLATDERFAPRLLTAAPSTDPGVVNAVTTTPRTFTAQGYGSKLVGSLNVNGRSYDFVNGGSKRGSIPPGEYTITRYTSGSQRAAEGFSYRKDAFMLTDVRDNAPGTKGQDLRRGLLIHEAKRGITAGCIGITGDFEAFKADMFKQMEANGGKPVKLVIGGPEQSQVLKNVGALPQNTRMGLGAPRVIDGNVTAYSPQKVYNSMEGGYASSRPGPDGKAEVRTLTDYVSGKAEYITLAGDPSNYGKSYTIPEISWYDSRGTLQTAKNVRAVVHDTGSAFKGQPEGRYDIPIDRDASNGQMNASHGLWRKNGIQFIPN